MPGVSPEKFQVINRSNAISPELTRLNSVIATDGLNTYQFGKLLK